MTQGERVKMIRKEKGLTLDQFGEKIGLKKSALSHIENDKSGLTPQIAKLIAHEFNVNEEWLREGTGEMFNELTEQEETAAFLGKIMRKDMDGNIRQRLIHILSQLSEEEWISIEKIARQIAKEYSKDE